MPTIALVNPNTSQSTTDLMVWIARRHLTGTELEVRGYTVVNGPSMITDAAALTAAAQEVVAVGAAAAADPEVVAIIVSAFGDPGVEELRAAVGKPVVGIAEAAFRVASAGGRRFGVATTTPGLAAPIIDRVLALGHGPVFTGVRLTPTAPLVLSADPDRQLDELRTSVQESIDHDGAQAVIIGGGPLGQSAEDLAPLFDIPVLGPIPAACAEVPELLG